MFAKKFILILYGPTAVGKTDVALALAQRIPAEIINGDLGQFYTPLSIGTAKPDWRSFTTPHHLFDVLDEPKNFTVAQYRQRVMKVVSEIWGRKKTPIIVGGSGFYIKSLFFPPQVESFENSIELTGSNIQLWEKLWAIDPIRARAIHQSDRYRIKRALTIWLAKGEQPSQYAPAFKPPGEFYMSVITRDRQDLYNRINDRVSIMIKQGWIQEVMRLHNTSWEQFLHEKKLIGYELILDYLAAGANELALPMLVDNIAQRTRNYAKRQDTFGRMLITQLNRAIGVSENLNTSVVESANLTLLSLDLYLKQLLHELSNRYQ